MAWTTCRVTMSAPRLKAVPSASRSPGLHRPNSRHRLHGAATASATAVLPCTLFVSSRNPSEQGRGLVFLYRSNRAILQLFARTPPAIQRSRLSASREGSRAIASHYAGSPVDSMRGAALCTAADCAVLQPGNGEAEAPGGARWVLRSHNDTMAFSLSKTPLPMILGPSWNSEL
jgi:hypothetical protein